MYIGSNQPLPEYALQYGFKVVDHITILGMKIKKNLENLSDCHIVTEQKITKIINFWERFNLSLPGRINIAKTLLLSQISYLGCIITPASDTLKRLSSQINRFIVGRLNIAKDRICRPISLGGLGMINLEEFLIAQQVSWFKRADSSTRDNWRVDLKKIGNGNVLTVGKTSCSYETFPIFKFLIESFHKFLYSFNNLNDNFSKSLLLNNPLLTISREDRRPLGINFFTNSLPDIDLSSVCTISMDQIANNNRLLSLDEITANTRVNFNLICYLRLQSALHSLQNRTFNNRPTDGSSISLSNFFKRFRKGSRLIRNILSGHRLIGIKVCELRNILTFENSINIPSGTDKIKMNFLRFWGFNFFPMALREFSFKLYNNSLGLNHRLAHFVAGRGNGCSFCSTHNNGPVHPESSLHFFFDCVVSTRLRERFERIFLAEIALNSREDRIKLWFYGILPALGDNSNIFILAVVQTFFFSLWRIKLHKRIPTQSSFDLEFFFTLDKIVSSSGIVREHMANVDIFLCRNWDDIQHRRG